MDSIGGSTSSLDAVEYHPLIQINIGVLIFSGRSEGMWVLRQQGALNRRTSFYSYFEAEGGDATIALCECAVCTRVSRATPDMLRRRLPQIWLLFCLLRIISGRCAGRTTACLIEQGCRKVAPAFDTSAQTDLSFPPYHSYYKGKECC